MVRGQSASDRPIVGSRCPHHMLIYRHNVAQQHGGNDQQLRPRREDAGAADQRSEEPHAQDAARLPRRVKDSNSCAAYFVEEVAVPSSCLAPSHSLARASIFRSRSTSLVFLANRRSPAASLLWTMVVSLSNLVEVMPDHVFVPSISRRFTSEIGTSRSHACSLRNCRANRTDAFFRPST